MTLRTPWVFAIVALLLLAGCGPAVDGGAAGGGFDDQVARGGTGGTGDGGDDGGDGGGEGAAGEDPPGIETGTDEPDFDDPGAGEEAAAGDGGSFTALQITLAGREDPWIESLKLTVQGIDAHLTEEPEQADGAWVEIQSEAQLVDVMELTEDDPALLLDTSAPTAPFDRIRVRVEDASLTVYEGTFDAQLLSSGQDTGSLPASLEADEAGVLRIDLDFDPLASVRLAQDSHFQIQPEFRLIDPSAVGSISGTVSPAGIDARVSAYDSRNGAWLAVTRVREDGSYTLPRLEAAWPSGEPLVYRLVATADGYHAAPAEIEAQVVPAEDSGGHDFILEPESVSGTPGNGHGWGRPDHSWRWNSGGPGSF